MQESHSYQRLERILDSWKHWNVEGGDYPTILRTLNGGLTNESVVVLCGSTKVIVRQNSFDSVKLGINRQHEALILDKVSAAGIGPKLLFSSEGSYLQSLNFSILEYVKGHPWQQEEFYKKKNLPKLKALIAKYQTLKFDATKNSHSAENLSPFNYAEHIQRYWDQLSKQNPNTIDRLSVDYLSFRQRLLQFQEKAWAPVLAHHDLTPENIIENGDGLMIIDWEYAGLGHSSFDTLFLDAFSIKDPTTPKDYLEDQDIVEEIIYWINTLWFCLTSEV